jgi:hypothetical protein
MDNFLRGMMGSPGRDAFKFWHKHLAPDLYGADADLDLVSKRLPGIVARLDFKQPGDSVSFAEVLAYNHMREVGISVYLVIGEVPPRPRGMTKEEWKRELVTKGFRELTVVEYLGGDWKPDPPRYETRVVLEGVPPWEYLAWERELRAAREGGQVA